MPAAMLIPENPGARITLEVQFVSLKDHPVTEVDEIAERRNDG
jgi:hypothetical protein